MEWQHFAEWLFFGSVGFIFLYIARTIEKLRQSVEKLNVNVALVISKTREHEVRIRRLEKKR